MSDYELEQDALHEDYYALLKLAQERYAARDAYIAKQESK